MATLFAEGAQLQATTSVAATPPWRCAPHYQVHHACKKKALSFSARHCTRLRAALSSSSSEAPGSGGGSSSSTATLETAVEKVKLGASNVEVTKVGIGAWSWGDTFYWNNGSWSGFIMPESSFQLRSSDRNSKGRPLCGVRVGADIHAYIDRLLPSFILRNIEDARAAFNASMDAGINFFDTAEVYGSKGFAGGEDSEGLLRRFIEERKRIDNKDIVVATKFAALPWRLGSGSLVCALKESLKRLGLASVDLYQLHWPGVWGNEAYIDGLADAVEQGLVKAVGVSNYNERRLRSAHAQLKKRGIPLASNQVNYSLIYRNPESNGVKNACMDLGVTLIAYSPIAQGVLSGKYTPENPPSGPRGRIYNKEYLTKATPLLQAMREVGQRYGKTPTQVSLNWLLAQGDVIPIPGAKTAAQAKEFAGALGWTLTSNEVQELRQLASKVAPVMGFPVESF